METEKAIVMAEDLPEDVVVNILTRLPVKSLIRFRCVSKRWRSIISDPNFAKSHYSEQKTPNHRLLISTAASQLESLDLESPSSFEDACPIRKLASLLEQSEPELAGRVQLLGSCNGLICVAELNQITPYIWNPSTGLLQKLPNPGICKHEQAAIAYSGFGYSSATDDYKVLVSTFSCDELLEVEVFSLRAQAWKKIQCPLYGLQLEGLLLNQSLHWLNDSNEPAIMALDLAEADEFRIMMLPNFGREGPYANDWLLVSLDMSVSGGYLYVLRCPLVYRDPLDFGFPTKYVAWDCIELWIMREYDVHQSWTKLFSFKVSNQPERIFQLHPVLIMETSTVMVKLTSNSRHRLVRIEHKEEEPVIECKNDYDHGIMMIVYEESLLWIDDYLGPAEETRNPTQGLRNQE